MKPFNNDFILNQMGKYLNIIREQESNEYCVKKQKIYTKEAYMYNADNIEEKDEILLLKDNKCIMKLNEKEIQGTYNVVKNAYGHVGIAGLGLGYCAEEMAENPRVKSVTVYEISEDVIQIYKNNFKDNSKINIIHGDAFCAESKKFDVFFSDIYSYELTDRVVHDYKVLNHLHQIEEYYFWGMEHFLLSCAYEDLLWVYVPENWVESSKQLYEALDMAGNLDCYYQLDADKVKKILMEFKEILNA